MSQTCKNCGNEYDTATAVCNDCSDLVCLNVVQHLDGEPSECLRPKGIKQEVCFECAANIRAIQDSQAAIFRSENLPKTQHLTGIEMIGIRTDHYNWCAAVFQSGPDAIQRISRHIDDIAKQIEVLRIQESASRQKRAELEFVETEHLTVEERQRWEKDARKMKERSEIRQKQANENKSYESAEAKDIKKLTKNPLIDVATATWIVEKEKSGTKREKLMASVMRTGISRLLAEQMTEGQ